MFMKQTRRSPTRRGTSDLVRFALLPSLILIAGCASFDAGDRMLEPVSQDESSAAEIASRAAQVYVYPTQGQSAEHIDRDRYECYVWAVEQSGFDPSQPTLAPHQRVEVMVAPAAGADTVSGAITGAVLGAVVASPRHTGSGAVVGAVIGGVLGSASDAARAQEAQRIRRGLDQYDAERLARVEQQSIGYRRALTACLEGRGYTVK
jgi:hypothetical protein